MIETLKQLMQQRDTESDTSKIVLIQSQIDDTLDELANSDAYMEYIMEHGDRPCYNGDMLIGLAESFYLFDDFVESLL